MTTKEIIEKLKDPNQAQPFGLRSPEEQEVFREAGPENSLLYTVTESWVTPTGLNGPNSTFILKPGYEPEPEYVDLEITDILFAVSEHGMWGWTTQFEVIRENKRVFARFRKE